MLSLLPYLIHYLTECDADINKRFNILMSGIEMEANSLNYRSASLEPNHKCSEQNHKLILLLRLSLSHKANHRRIYTNLDECRAGAELYTSRNQRYISYIPMLNIHSCGNPKHLIGM